MWVWAYIFLHYTVGFGTRWFFGLGCFSCVVFVWGVCLLRTVNMDYMLGSVGVGVGLCWRLEISAGAFLDPAVLWCMISTQKAG